MVSQNSNNNKPAVCFYQLADTIYGSFLTHSAREYFEKLAFQKNKKSNFKRLYLKSQDIFRVNTNLFRKFMQFSLEKGGFLHALPTWVHGWGLRLLQPQCRCQRLARLKELTLFRMGGGSKSLPLHQLFSCNFFKRRNQSPNLRTYSFNHFATLL